MMCMIIHMILYYVVLFTVHFASVVFDNDEDFDFAISYCYFD
jgi:hypothetical protein